MYKEKTLKNNNKGLILPEVKPSVIRTVWWYWHKNRQTDQRHRRQSRDINTQRCSHLGYNKSEYAAQ